MDGPNAARINSLPVLSFSFGDCEGTASKILAGMADAICEEYRRYRFICEKMPEDDVSFYESNFSDLMREDSNYFRIDWSMSNLSRLVSRHFGQRVMVLIDDYDVPMMSACKNGCYGELRAFFRNLFISALKDNDCLEKAILTGVQRIEKANILSGLDNLDVHTVAHCDYSDCFGFTQDQTRWVFENCGLNVDDLAMQAFGAYRFGESRLYSPLAVINHARLGKPYGNRTGFEDNDGMAEILKAASPMFIDNLDRILRTGSAQVKASLETAVYEDVSDRAIWGLFVNAGYLTFADIPDSGSKEFTLCIPNSEMRDALLEIIDRRCVN